MCHVVNFKRYGSATALDGAFGRRWLYIGRANPRYALPRSPLANPYRRSDFGNTPGATLPYYRQWLWQRINAGDAAVLAALHALDASTALVCWCAPGPCHGDVVRSAARWLRRQSAE